MKIIDLLNKIANGDIPKSIKYGGYIYQWNNNIKNYEREIDIGTILNWDYIAMECLNKEVEILEEPKGIPEKICTNRIINTKDILEFEMIQNKINAEYTYAINWILDYLKSKGE